MLNGICIGILNGALSLIFIYVCFSTFFVIKPIRIGSVYFGSLYILWQIVLSTIRIQPILTLVVCLLIMCAFINYLFKGNILVKIGVCILIITLWSFCEVLVVIVFEMLDIGHISSLFVFLAASIISKVMIYLIFLLLRLIYINNNKNMIKSKYMIFIYAIPIGSMYIIYEIFMLNKNSLFTYTSTNTIISIIILGLINIIVFKSYINMTNDMLMKMNYLRYEQQLEMCIKQTNENRLLINEFRILRHDIKQHYTILNELVKNNNNELAIDYLKEITQNDTIFKLEEFTMTGNIILDSIISTKRIIAINKGINFNVDIKVPEYNILSAPDLSLLLGNIIDNAIEANLSDSINEKYIKLNIRYESDKLFILCINSYKGYVKKDKVGKLISNKENNVEHGIGLLTINDICLKYNGELIIENDHHEFKLMIFVGTI